MFRYPISLFLFLVILFCSSCDQGQDKKLTMEDKEAQNLLDKADAFERNNIDSAYYYSNEALLQSRKTKAFISEIKSLNNLGYALNLKAKPKEAFQKYTEALQLAEKIGDSAQISKCLNFQGTFFNNYGDYETGLDYFLKALPYREGLQDSVGIAVVTGNIGLNYTRLNNYQLSLIHI